MQVDRPTSARNECTDRNPFHNAYGNAEEETVGVKQESPGPGEVPGVENNSNAEGSMASGEELSSDGEEKMSSETRSLLLMGEALVEQVDPWVHENPDAHAYMYPGGLTAPQHLGQKPVPPKLDRVDISSEELAKYVKLGTIDIPVKVRARHTEDLIIDAHMMGRPWPVLNSALHTNLPAASH